MGHSLFSLWFYFLSVNLCLFSAFNICGTRTLFRTPPVSKTCTAAGFSAVQGRNPFVRMPPTPSLMLTLLVLRLTPRRSLGMVLAMSDWSAKARYAPTRHNSDDEAYGHTTTAIYISFVPMPRRQLAGMSGFSGIRLRRCVATNSPDRAIVTVAGKSETYVSWYDMHVEESHTSLFLYHEYVHRESCAICQGWAMIELIPLRGKEGLAV